MKNYTVGFLLHKQSDQVLLIHKNRPLWQRGFLNGVGGLVEGEESIEQGLVREMKEETNIPTTDSSWVLFGEKAKTDMTVYFLYAYHQGELSDAVTMTDEEVEWFSLKNLPTNLANDTRSMIDHFAGKLDSTREINYKVIEG